MAAMAAERTNICRRETSAGKPCSDTVVLLIDEKRCAGGSALAREVRSCGVLR